MYNDAICQDVKVSTTDRTIIVKNDDAIAALDSAICIENLLVGGSSSTGSGIGILNKFIANDGFQYGTMNLMSTVGSASRYGTFSAFRGTNSGSNFGSHNDFTLSSSFSQSGYSNTFACSGSAAGFGLNNFFSGTTAAEQTGVISTFANNTSGEHNGMRNEFQGSSSGPRTGIKNNFAGSGTGLHIGLKNNINVSGNNNHVGVDNVITSSGNGGHYGINNTIASAGSGNKYGIFNNMNSLGAGSTYAVYNYLHNMGTSNQYGTYCSILNATAPSLFGNYAIVTGDLNTKAYGYTLTTEQYGTAEVIGINNLTGRYGSGTSIATGIKNEISVFNTGIIKGIENIIDGQPQSTGDHYVNYNTLQTFAATGNRFGVYSKIFGTQDGGGIHYGSYNTVSSVGAGDRFGTYNTISGVNVTGKSVAGYFESETGGGNDFAAIFQKGKVVVNEAAGDYDFRVESMGFNNMLLVDADQNRLGVRTASPTDVLHVNSSTSENAFRVEVGGTTKLRVYANGSLSIGSNNTTVSPNDVHFEHQLGFGKSNPTYRLDLQNSAVDSLGKGRANAWDVYSDARVKRNVNNLAYGLNEVMQLRPVSYNHHASEFENGKLIVKREHENTIGFIAQEVNNVIKEIVSKPNDENTDLWAMNYEKLTPVLVKAIQEQQKVIEELRNQNTKTAYSLDLLKAELESIKSFLAATSNKN